MERINSKTRLIGLIGNPLAHTFSPLKHNYCFKKLNLNYLYLPIETSLDYLKDTIDAMRSLSFAGFNITFPFKVEVMKYLDEIDSDAMLIGAVNCVRIDKSKLIGFNTDGTAYLRSLIAEIGPEIKGFRFLMLGCGGAGRAIATTLVKHGVKAIELFDIDNMKSTSLANDLRSIMPTCNIETITTDIVDLALQRASVLINATALGMHPYEGVSPVHSSLLRSNLIVSDITYNPPKTQLLLDAEKVGAKCLNGMGMAIYEGIESSKVWTGVEPAFDDMKWILEFQLKTLLDNK